MGTICSSEIIHLKDGILDIRYGAGNKLSGNIDELDMFLYRNYITPDEIVLTPDQFNNLRNSILDEAKDEFVPRVPNEQHRTHCKVTVRQFGH